MSKTPVSILQEMMVKKQTVPNYELIHDGGGTHMNTFVYRVTCDGLIATGTGRSKKDAKHEAAQAMLETIAAHRGYPQLPASPAESPVRTPLPPTMPEPQRVPPNVPFINAIGALQDVCAENNLQKPEYVQISDIGPPHAKIFTIQCVVANFREVGVAKTKKLAKQEAAKKMFDKIIDLLAESKDANFTLETEDDYKKEKQFNDTAKARYPSLSRLSTSKKINLGVKLSEYHIKIKESIANDIRDSLIEKLQSFASYDENDFTQECSEQVWSDLKVVLSIIDIDISSITLQTAESDEYITCMKVNTIPEIVQIALGKTELQAEFITMKKLIDTLLHLLL